VLSHEISQRRASCQISQQSRLAWMSLPTRISQLRAHRSLQFNDWSQEIAPLVANSTDDWQPGCPDVFSNRTLGLFSIRK